MKVRGGILLSCATGALLLAASTAAVRAADQDQPFPVKAPPVDNDWWWHGDVEVGGRGFLNNPTRNGSAYTGSDSLAKFYEYRDLRPGPFSNMSFLAGSKDGLYQVGFWAKNIGYNDQSYFLDVSKAGVAYFTFGWDETPHIYSTSAQTPYLGVGTNALTLPAGLPSATVTNASRIVPYLYTTDIGIQRNTASSTFRWTPTDAWDVRADYSYLDRTGTQVAGVLGFAPKGGSTFSSPTQVIAPVADNTQNTVTNAITGVQMFYRLSQ